MMARCLRKLICVENHHHGDYNCYSFDVPTLSAKVASHHTADGKEVEHIRIEDCVDPKCFNPVKY